MTRAIFVWTVLAVLVLWNGCATGTPSMGECGTICRDGDVDYFKSRDLQCQCHERLDSWE